MNKSLAFLLVIAGIIIFILGGGAGVFYQTQKVQLNNPQNIAAEAALKALSSKVVPSIVAFGNVASISGRNVTLNYSGENLTIRIDETAQISSFTAPQAGSKATASQATVEFKDIKIGNTLSINLRLLPDGALRATSVVIINSLPETNVNPK